MNVEFNCVTHTVSVYILAINGDCGALGSYGLGNLKSGGLIICRNFLLILIRWFWNIFWIFWYIPSCCCYIDDSRSEISFFYCISISYRFLFSYIQFSEIKAVVVCHYNTFQAIGNLDICEFNITSIFYGYLISNDIIQ